MFIFYYWLSLFSSWNCCFLHMPLLFKNTDCLLDPYSWCEMLLTPAVKCWNEWHAYVDCSWDSLLCLHIITACSHMGLLIKKLWTRCLLRHKPNTRQGPKNALLNTAISFIRKVSYPKFLQFFYITLRVGNQVIVTKTLY